MLENSLQVVDCPRLGQAQAAGLWMRALKSVFLPISFTSNLTTLVTAVLSNGDRGLGFKISSRDLCGKCLVGRKNMEELFLSELGSCLPGWDAFARLLWERCCDRESLGVTWLTRREIGFTVGSWQV